MRRRIPYLLAVGAIAGLVAAGCGGSSDESAPTAGTTPTEIPPAAGAPIPGGGLTIDEALASTLTGPLMVKGHLVVDGDGARLCSVLLESYPPQCGGPSLAVQGLDLESVEGLEKSEDGTVTWSNQEVSLLGLVEEGVLTVSTTSI